MNVFYSSGEGFQEYFRGPSLSKSGVKPALLLSTWRNCFPVLGPRCLTCVFWEGRWGRKKGEKGKGENGRKICRRVRIGERHRKINKRKRKENLKREKLTGCCVKGN